MLTSPSTRATTMSTTTARCSSLIGITSVKLVGKFSTLAVTIATAKTTITSLSTTTPTEVK